MPPQDIVHEPMDSGHKRQIRPGDTIVITYEMMYLSEQLLKHEYWGKAKVKFVFAEAEKDHKKWIRIKPSSEYWAREEVVRDCRQ